MAFEAVLCTHPLFPGSPRNVIALQILERADILQPLEQTVHSSCLKQAALGSQRTEYDTAE